jgi:hypothetical protein
MAEPVHGVNTITIAGEPFLLAMGIASHLVAEVKGNESGRPAVEPWRFERVEDWQASYDRKELQAPRWRQRTLCGRDWSAMARGDGPGLVPWSSPVYAPNCRTCLRIASRRLESRPADDRIPLVAALAMQEVLEYGESRVDGVPGDQAEALRAALRQELQRHGLRGHTYHLREVVFVISEDAYKAVPQERKDELQQQLMRALDWVSDEPSPPIQTGISWKTWELP